MVPPTAHAPFAIRPARPDDAPALAALMDGIYAERRWFVGDVGPTAGELRRRLRALDPARLWFGVAVAPSGDGEALLGWLEARRFALPRLAHVASLTLAVAPEARRRGVGRSLLRAVEPWAARVGVVKLRLDVRASNAAALALYAAEGYVEEGRERRQIRDADGEDDNVVLAKFLD